MLTSAAATEKDIFSHIASASIAGFTATIITQPFDVAKTRIQLHPNIYRNFFHCAFNIVRKEGAKRLFDGMLLRSYQTNWQRSHHLDIVRGKYI